MGGEGGRSVVEVQKGERVRAEKSLFNLMLNKCEILVMIAVKKMVGRNFVVAALEKSAERNVGGGKSKLRGSGVKFVEQTPEKNYSSIESLGLGGSKTESKNMYYQPREELTFPVESPCLAGPPSCSDQPKPASPSPMEDYSTRRLKTSNKASNFPQSKVATFDEYQKKKSPIRS
jgi:hypothetical protein